MSRRGPGRPSRPTLTREAILPAALQLLEREGLAGTTMRALARALRVDPMALYHYFPDRDALLAAAAAHAYATFRSRAPRGDWRAQLTALAFDYVEFLAGSGELLRYVTADASAAAVPTTLFARHVTQAIGDAPVAHDVFVDFLHGFALGVPRTGLTPSLRRRLRSELAIVLAGIESSRPRRRTRSRV